MGVSGRRGIILTLSILAVIAVISYILSVRKSADSLLPEDVRFIDVYTEMALAREMAGNDTVYLDSLYSDIYERYDVDSVWISNYASAGLRNAEGQKKIWDLIVGKFDSLRSAPNPDSGTVQ